MPGRQLCIIFKGDSRMEDRESVARNIVLLVDRLTPYISEEEVRSRLRVDLIDLADIARWFLETITKRVGGAISEDDVESLLIEIDVRFIDHATDHMRSLKKLLSGVLENLGADHP